MPITRERAWLAVWFPCFSLQVQQQAVRDAVSCASVIQRHGQQVILDVSASARAAGVEAGMPLSAAYVLCPDMQVWPADFQCQHAWLERLAEWAMRYSSQVSVQPPDALLLELQGSLRLFAGRGPLLEDLAGTLAVHWRLDHVLVLTPVPTASLLLARYAGGVVNTASALCAAPGDMHCLQIESLTELRAVLGALQVNRVGLQPALVERLRAIGIRRLQDLWRLPVAGLRQRFGDQLLQWLDSLVTAEKTPSRYFRPEEVFSAQHDFPVEVRSTVLLLPVIDKLVTRLVGFLRDRDMMVEKLQLELIHHHASPTSMEVVFSLPSRNRQRILLLIQQQMENMVLPLPVTAVRLSGESFCPYQAGHTDLFAVTLSGTVTAAASKMELWQQLVEQLQARLGRQAVLQFQPVDEHRPEKAWRHLYGLARSVAVAAGSRALRKQNSRRRRTQDGVPGPLRPVWLLPGPVMLRYARGKVYYHGQVLSLSAAERIESGWWDGEEIRRDYYYATSRQGAAYWIFRDLKSARWYLHGVFA